MQENQIYDLNQYIQQSSRNESMYHVQNATIKQTM